AYLPEQNARVSAATDDLLEAAEDGNEEVVAPARTIVNQCAVFSEKGELIGTQSKVLGSGEDEDLARRGRTFNVVPTSVGRLGIMLGGDVLYPEVGRLLAYQDAEMLVLQGACTSMAM